MAAGNTYTPIATTTLGSTTTSYTFSSIPQTYTDLVLVINAIGAGAGGGRNAIIRFNSDSAGNYSQTYAWGDGSSAGSGRNSNLTYMQTSYYGYFDGTQRGISITSINDYSNTTTYKNTLSRGASATGSDMVIGMWRNTSAVSSITLLTNSGDYGSGSTFTLYGILEA